MIDKRSALTIKHDDNSVFADYSHKMAAFGRDSVTMTITNAEDYVWVGFDKPINAVYVDITTPNGSEGSLEVQYWNGSSYVDVSEKSDDTLGLYRSGFVRWERELTNQAVSTVDSEEMYWYRILPSVDRTGIVVSGLNLVFSDDYELSLEQPYISDTEFLGSESSHIKTHVAVKNEIIQKFRNKNYVKYDSVTSDKVDIDCWDLLDIEEVKLAASYLALSKIYFGLSDNPEDVWASKSAAYRGMFDKYIDLARLSIDVDDDGLVSVSENKPAFKTRYFTR